MVFVHYFQNKSLFGNFLPTSTSPKYSPFTSMKLYKDQHSGSYPEVTSGNFFWCKLLFTSIGGSIEYVQISSTKAKFRWTQPNFMRLWQVKSKVKSIIKIENWILSFTFRLICFNSRYCKIISRTSVQMILKKYHFHEYKCPKSSPSCSKIDGLGH